VEQALFFQGEAPIAFTPEFILPPAETLFLASGNLPALLVSLTVRPEALRVTPAKRWDPIWFAIHEAVSFLLWFVVGILLDRGLLRISKLMAAYIVVRFGFAAFLLVHGVAEIGWRVEVLAWWAFVVYGIVLALRWILSRARIPDPMGILQPHRLSRPTSPPAPLSSAAILRAAFWCLARTLPVRRSMHRAGAFQARLRPVADARGSALGEDLL
jgi:hypothetical protein